MVTGNFIGTGIDGSTKVSNGESGVWVSGDSNATQIGIYKDGADDLVVGNIISGNRQSGIASLRSTNLKVAGNFIGTDISGSVRLANGKSGISLDAEVTDASIGTELVGSPGGFVGNIISGNVENGIFVANTASRIGIGSNIIGLGVDGVTPVPNDLSGVSVVDGASQVVIGGESFEQSNTISGNGRHGIYIRLSNGNSVFGNMIGLADDGQSPAGNTQSGIRIEQASNTLIGYDPQATVGSFPDAINLIAHNGTTGIAIIGDLSQGNQINQNYIFGHTQIAVDLGNDGATLNDATDSDVGPNGLQNFPVIQVVATNPLATQIGGSLQGDPSETYRIDFYARQGSGTVIESMEFLDSLSVVTNASGQSSWSTELDFEVPAGSSVIANARSIKNGTSEFSQPKDSTTLRALNLTFASPSVIENIGSVQLTIDRGDLPLGQGVTLTLTSNDRPLVNPPASVVLPGGTQSITVVVPITDNNIVEPNRTVEVAATLFGIALGKTQIEVIDNTESVWHNSVLPRDVNGDGKITPVDALLIISLLNRFGSSRSVSQLTPPETGVFYPDVNDDGIVSPVDALLVISTLNRSGGSAEGEAALVSDPLDLLDLLEIERLRRRRSR
jgi:Dockerin type I domain